MEWVGDGVVWVGGLRGVGEAKVGQDWMSVGVRGVLNWEIVSSRSCVCTRYAMLCVRFVLALAMLVLPCLICSETMCKFI